MSKKSKKPGRVRAAILSWLGVPITLMDEAFWSEWASNKNAAGQSVNEQTVLSLSAAWACTRLIAESVGTVPGHIYERTSSGRRRATEHPLYNILHSKPNPSSTATSYWEAKTASLLLRGNGFSEKRLINGRLVSLNFLAPNRLSGSRNINGKFVFRYTESDRTQREIPRSNIFHIPGFSLDGEWGLSAISYGASVFGSALASSTAANSTFEKGLAPTVAFTFPHILKEGQRREFRENFKEHIAGAVNAGESPLLEGGMGVEQVGINPRDAQLLESREFSIEEVCRWFRVDPSMVGHGNKDSNWGTGLEQKMIAFLTFTLRPWLTRIEQSVNTTLFSPIDQQRYYFEFSIEALLRADSATRAAFYSVMVNNGIFTRDEVRQLENMPQKGGNADVLTVQSAMAPLDSLGNQNPGDQVRSALQSWLNTQPDNGGTND